MSNTASSGKSIRMSPDPRRAVPTRRRGCPFTRVRPSLRYERARRHRTFDTDRRSPLPGGSVTPGRRRALTKSAWWPRSSTMGDPLTSSTIMHGVQNVGVRPRI